MSNITRELLARIERLERANRVHRRIGAGAALVVAAVFVGGMVEDEEIEVNDLVVAKELRVVTDDGCPVISLRGTHEGGVVALSTAGSDTSTPSVRTLSLTSSESGGEISLSNSKGMPVVELSSLEHEGLVTVRSRDGSTAARLEGSAAGGEISVWNAKGMPVVLLDAAEDGGAVGVRNQAGEYAITLDVDAAGIGEIGAWAANGEGRTMKPGQD